jgi:hypothetical protein
MEDLVGIHNSTLLAEIAAKPLGPCRGPRPIPIGPNAGPQRSFQLTTGLDESLAMLVQANPFQLTMDRHSANRRQGLRGPPAGAIDIKEPSARLFVLTKVTKPKLSDLVQAHSRKEGD